MNNCCKGETRGRCWQGRSIASLVIGLWILGALHTKGHFVPDSLAHLLYWLIPPAVLLGIFRLKTRRPREDDLRRLAPALILCGCALIFIFSSAASHMWFYFVRWFPGGSGLLASESERFILLTVLLTPLFVIRWKRTWVLLLAILLYSQFASVDALLTKTGGAALYRTDHPSFMFRLHEFSSTFPSFVNYNPFWNAGSLHYYSVTTGSAGPGLLLMPWLKIAPVHVVYTYGLAFLFILLVPWIAVGSVRLAGGDKTAAFAGGILVMGVSQHYFLWMLHYGTIGAALTASMVVPMAAVFFRIVVMNRRSWQLSLGLVSSAFFLLLWPPGALMGAGFGISYLLQYRKWTRRKWIFLVICGIAVLLLYIPFISVLTHEGGNVVEYVLHKKGAEDAAQKALHIDWGMVVRGGQHLIAHLQEFHPLLIFLGLVGVFTASRRSIRWWYGPAILYLVFLAGWGRELKPNLQLSRMAIPLAFACVVPAAMLVSRLLRTRDLRLALLRGGLVALLSVSGYNISLIYRNLSNAPYKIKDAHVDALVDALRQYTPENTRVMFAGKTVHAYGRGQIAYLPVLAEREMMACDYYNFPMDTVEYNYPPAPFRKPESNFDLFVNSYNIGSVLTYHEDWKKYLRARPELFEEVWVWDYVSMFKLKRDPKPLLSGKGSVTADFNRIAVHLDEPTEEVVLSYNWLDGLRTKDPVEIYPHTVTNGIKLIGVRTKGARNFLIRF
ncbi:MAG: hypothetical protein AB7T27_01415 [Kiritimatiellia bacterium]